MHAQKHHQRGNTRTVTCMYVVGRATWNWMCILQWDAVDDTWYARTYKCNVHGSILTLLQCIRMQVLKTFFWRRVCIYIMLELPIRAINFGCLAVLDARVCMVYRVMWLQRWCAVDWHLRIRRTRSHSVTLTSTQYSLNLTVWHHTAAARACPTTSQSWIMK